MATCSIQLCQSCFANSAAIHPGHNFLSTDDILAAVENEVGSTAERAGSADRVEGDAGVVEDLKDSEGEAEEAEDDDDWCILCYKCGQHSFGTDTICMLGLLRYCQFLRSLPSILQPRACLLGYPPAGHI